MRKKNKKRNNYKIIFLILLLGIFLFNFREDKYYEIKELSGNIGEKNNFENVENTITKVVTNVEKEYKKENVLTNYKGYEVLAKLEIPVINLETYVLSEFSKEALNISVTKFFGSNVNEVGNFCIAGHNFINKNMFRNLKKLKINDVIFLIDNKIGKVEYKVYDIFQVFPEDTNSLNQNTKNKEITLITCTNDSKKRIIVKAKEKL